MDHALDAFLELDEGAVVGHADDLAADNGADRIALLDGVPRVGRFLLEAEADALALRIEIENHDLDVVAHGHDLRGVLDAAPGHVGDVEQAVDAAEVDEGAEIGDVLDFAGDDLADFDGLEELFLLTGALLFEELAAADDDVAAPLGQLDDFHLHRLADVALEIAGGPPGELAGGHEGVDADIDLEPAFDAADNLALDDAVLLVNFLDMGPVLDAVGLDLGEHGHALLILRRLDVDIELIADLQLLRRAELVEIDDTFAFVANIDENAIGPHVDDGAFDDLALAEVLHRRRVGLLEFGLPDLLVRAEIDRFFQNFGVVCHVVV